MVKIDVLKLTSEIPPSVNHYLALRTFIKNGKAKAMNYKTQQAYTYQKNFAQYLSDEIQKQGWNLEPNKTQHFYVDAVFYFPRLRMDCNNYWKVMLDAITDTQLIWLDDDVVCERVQGIFYDTENPRVEITITPVEYIGIFRNEDEYRAFVEKCESCGRYARNCSILSKAREGRIQSDIIKGACAKYKQKK